MLRDAGSIPAASTFYFSLTFFDKDLQQEEQVASLSGVPRRLLPALHKLHKQKAQLERNLLITHLAAALKAYKCKHGEYPVKLSDLPNALPRDTYTGGPFVYERTDRGCRFLSAVGNGEGPLVLHEVPLRE